MLQLALILVLLPPVLLGIQRMLDNRAFRVQAEHLSRVPFMVVAWDRSSCEPIAARERVVIARLDMQGAPIFRTAPLSGIDSADARLPAWPARDEVRSALAGNGGFGRYVTPDGSARVQALAQPRPEGGALYVVTASDRGFARLASTRNMVILDILLAVVLTMRTVVLARRPGGEGPAELKS